MMENYTIKQNTTGIIQAYISPILSLIVIAVLLFYFKGERLAMMSAYIILLVVLVGYRYIIYIKRPMTIEVNGDKIKFKTVLGKITELTFSDITDIELIKRREIYFTVNGNKIRSLNTYKDFDTFLDDAKKKNPELKLWGFSKND